MDITSPHVCWLEGGIAIWKIQEIMNHPGVIGIDFETFPTAPAWHIEQAVAKAPRGKKAEARRHVKLWAAVNGQARRRQACTLQVRHENGEEAFCRLLDPFVELPQMFGHLAQGVTLVAHNAQFETEVLLKYGVALDVECTLLAAKALYLTAVPPDQPQPQSFSLKALVEKELGRTRDKTLRNRDWRLEESLEPEAIEYGLQDVRDCLELWQRYRERLFREGLWQGYEVVVRAALPTAAINLKGLTLDEEAHERLISLMRRQAHELEHDLDRVCGEVIDLHSAPQASDWIIGHVLQDELSMRDLSPYERQQRFSRFVITLIVRTEGACKGWKLTEKTGCLRVTKGSKVQKAEQLHGAYPQVSEYLLTHARWRKAQKLIEAFGAPLRAFQDQEDRRVRGQLKLGAAVTLRQSCVDPNLQQQPNELEFRALWVAPPGRKLAIADYSQIELRLLAIVANDRRLQEVYREGRDVHAETAVIAELPRKNAKNVNFAMAYGSGAAGLAENFGFTLAHAKEVLIRVLGAYTGLADYRHTAAEEAKAKGFISIRPSRKIIFDPATSPGTTAINYPIQGGAASVQMRALRLIYDGLRARPELDSFVAASVHDEFILETPDDERAEEASKIMVDGMVKALIGIFPEAGEMGLDRLSKAKVVGSWAEKE